MFKLQGHYRPIKERFLVPCSPSFSLTRNNRILLVWVCFPGRGIEWWYWFRSVSQLDSSLNKKKVASTSNFDCHPSRSRRNIFHFFYFIFLFQCFSDLENVSNDIPTSLLYQIYFRRYIMNAQWLEISIFVNLHGMLKSCDSGKMM